MDNGKTPEPVHRSAHPPEIPRAGGTVEVAPGVLWIRMPLPFVLDHVNLWAIEDDDGWAIVDTGIQHADLIAAWERLLAEDLGGRPVTRVLATHMHPDHAGLAGWLTERFRCRLWMSRTEYLAARSIATRTGTESTQGIEDFCRRAGWQPAEIAANIARRGGMARLYAPFPDCFTRLQDGRTLTIGGRAWHVIAGGGHTPEHACLHCPSLDLLISGDKVLPKISSNISVDAAEPDDDPLGEWFETLARIRRSVPNSVLVLPSHKGCFFGLHERIDQLIAEQHDALARLERALAEPYRVVDLFGTLFNQPIDRSNVSLFSLATGEAIALLNHLLATGVITSRRTDDGSVYYHVRSDAAAPGQPPLGRSTRPTRATA